MATHTARCPTATAASKDGLLPLEQEQTALARMIELHNAGASTHRIADTLTAEGHPTKRGGEWSSPTASRILARQDTCRNTSQHNRIKG